MKSKASLTLMEQLVMIPVFALAAAVCLQVFAGAQRISLETAKREAAMVVTQNAAELLKAGIEPERIEQRLDTEEFTVQIQEIPEEIHGFAQAQIRVFDEQEELIRLTVGYREVQP